MYIDPEAYSSFRKYEPKATQQDDIYTNVPTKDLKKRLDNISKDLKQIKKDLNEARQRKNSTPQERLSLQNEMEALENEFNQINHEYQNRDKDDDDEEEEEKYHKLKNEEKKDDKKDENDNNNNNIKDLNDVSDDLADDDDDDDDYDITEGRKLKFGEFQELKALNYSQIDINAVSQMNKVNYLIDKVLEKDYVKQYLEDEEIRTGKSSDFVKNEFRKKVKTLLLNNASIIVNDFIYDDEIADNVSENIFDLVIHDKYEEKNKFDGVVFYDYLKRKENEINAINERLEKQIEYHEELYPLIVREYKQLEREMDKKNLTDKKLKSILKRRKELRKRLDDMKAEIEKEKEDAKIEKIKILDGVKEEVAKNGNGEFVSDVIEAIDSDREDENGFQNSTKKMDSFSKMKSVFKDNKISDNYNSKETYNVLYFANALKNLNVSSLFRKSSIEKSKDFSNMTYKIASNLAKYHCLNANGTFAMPQSMYHLGIPLDEKSRKVLETSIKMFNNRHKCEIKSSNIYKDRMKMLKEDLKMLTLKTREQKHYEVILPADIFSMSDRHDIYKVINSEIKNSDRRKTLFQFILDKIKKTDKKAFFDFIFDKDTESQKAIDLVNERLARGEYKLIWEDGKLKLVNGYERSEERSASGQNPNSSNSNNNLYAGTGEAVDDKIKIGTSGNSHRDRYFDGKEAISSKQLSP